MTEEEKILAEKLIKAVGGRPEEEARGLRAQVENPTRERDVTIAENKSIYELRILGLQVGNKSLADNLDRIVTERDNYRIQLGAATREMGNLKCENANLVSRVRNLQVEVETIMAERDAAIAARDALKAQLDAFAPLVREAIEVVRIEESCEPEQHPSLRDLVEAARAAARAVMKGMP